MYNEQAYYHIHEIFFNVQISNIQQRFVSDSMIDSDTMIDSDGCCWLSMMNTHYKANSFLITRELVIKTNLINMQNILVIRSWVGTGSIALQIVIMEN